MGEVYRARDTKLGREVALKILPPAFTNDPERLARFRREAQVLASVNHPHIGAIYGLDDANGTQFLVLELVDGESLDRRIARGPIPVDETLTIAKQIAEALEAAHEKGIIHRDLKPANIALTRDGVVKVLDFGLAKATEPSSGTSFEVTNSPTITTPAMMTGIGVILGTAAYMSPEQAKGRPADHRSDIFAFGCVLFEMLTRRRAFDGDDPADVLASVIKVDVDLRALPKDINPRLPDLLGRCLAKSPKERWHAIGDVRWELDAIAADPRGAPRATPRVGPLRRPTAVIVVAGAALLVAATAVVTRRFQTVARHDITRFALPLPAGHVFTNTGRRFLALSPDGNTLAYIANQQLYLRRMSELAEHAIPGTASTTGITSPVFSPDSRWIAYWTGGKLQKIAVTGAAPVLLCDAPNPQGVSWVDEHIYFGASPQGIMRVSANGGKPEVVLPAPSGQMFYGPQLLPDGRSILVTVIGGNRTTAVDGQIAIRSLGTGASRVLSERASDARYVPTGHIIYAVGTTLLAIPFDARTLQVTGGPVPIIEGVRRGGTQTVAQYAFSETGSLVYVPTERAGDRNIAIVDRSGAIRRLDIPRGSYNHLRLSPNGEQIVFQSDDGATSDIWVYDVAGGGSPRRLTFGGRNSFPVWAPDGEHVVYMAERDSDAGMVWQRVNGGNAEVLLKSKGGDVFRPETWSPDGSVLVYSVNPASGAGKIWTLRVKDKTTPTLLIGESTGSQISSAISPDGHWIAYTSNEANRPQGLYVQPFPPNGAKYQIVADGAHFPRWTPDGHQIVYSTDDPTGTSELMASNIQTAPTFSFTPPRSVGVKNITTNRDRGGFDIMGDGRHFVVLMPQSAIEPGTATSEMFVVTLNWFEELNQRVPTK